MKDRNTFYDVCPVTSLLLMLCGGFFALEVIGANRAGVEGTPWIGFGGIPGKVWDDLGALWVSKIYYDHEYWRLVSSFFLHGGLLHLAMNGYALYGLGRLCEPILSTPKFFTIYALCGLGGSCAGYGWHLWRGQEHLSVGASGALCGLIGMLLVYSIRARDRHLREQIVRWVVMLAIITFLPRVDKLGHLGGFATGALLGFTVNGTTTSREARWWLAPAWILGAVVAVGLGFAIWNNGTTNWNWSFDW